MRLYSLGSGSSGNAFVLMTNQISLLIDCGVSIRACKSALHALGALETLAGIIVSHEHSDHVRAIPSVLRSHECPIVATAGTYAAMRSDARWSRLNAGQRFTESGVEISFVEVSHDAAEPCGFIVDADQMRVAVFTDLGIVTDAVLDALRNADMIVLESNFDPGMLRSGRYPAHLKRRIQSPVGHLSNDDCASALAAAVSSRTRAVWLAHLSHNNNRADIARDGARDALRLNGIDVSVDVLPRYGFVEITGQTSRQMQLSL